MSYASHEEFSTKFVTVLLKTCHCKIKLRQKFNNFNSKLLSVSKSCSNNAIRFKESKIGIYVTYKLFYCINTYYWHVT